MPDRYVMTPSDEDRLFAANAIRGFLRMGPCPPGYDPEDLLAFSDRLLSERASNATNELSEGAGLVSSRGGKKTSAEVPGRASPSRNGLELAVRLRELATDIDTQVSIMGRMNVSGEDARLLRDAADALQQVEDR